MLAIFGKIEGVIEAIRHSVCDHSVQLQVVADIFDMLGVFDDRFTLAAMLVTLLLHWANQ